MRIAFLSIGSPFTRASWSSIPFYTLQETQRRFADVHVIDTPALDTLIAKTGSLANYGLLPAREKPLTVAMATVVEQRLRVICPDVVLSIGAPHKVVDLTLSWPIVHVADAMFGTIVGYYAKYARLSPRSLRIGNAMQQRLIDRAAGLMLASDWAAESAARLYERPRDRFTVAPMGANLDDDPEPLIRLAAGPLRLLFIGYDWVRKGGPLVLAAFEAIRTALPDAELHIVGCRPAAAEATPGAVVHGCIDKADPTGMALLSDLFRTSHFFVMPSRQEAYGLVYCEACAFGLPPVAADTGGVGTIIRHGENGLLLPLSAGPQELADAILGNWHDPPSYTALQRGAVAAYRQRLNWRAWGAVLEDVLHRAVAGPALPMPAMAAPVHSAAC